MMNRLPVQAFARFTDANAMGEVWRQQMPILLGAPFEFAACNVHYARCRTYMNPASWHKSFLCVSYEFDAAPERNTSHKPMLYGRAYLQGRSRDAFSALVRPDGARHVAEMDMIVWNFPDDPRLPQLRELLDVTRAAQHFPYASLPFTADDIVEVKIDIVRYRPEQRCILRYEINYGHNRDSYILYAKVFADDNGRRVFSRIQHCHAIANTLGVRIARPLGYSAVVHALWQDELSGIPPTAALEAGEYAAPMAAIGHCLARLHAADLPMQEIVTRESRLTDVTKKSRKLAQMFPELAGDLGAIIARAQSELAQLPPAQKAVIHGDVHFGQFLITADGALALFDFDEWSGGDPAQDLADLIVDPHVRQFARDKTEIIRIPPAALARALLDSYRTHAAWTITDAMIVWHARIQLVNKAYRAAVQLESRWRERVPGLVALAIRGVDLGTDAEKELAR